MPGAPRGLVRRDPTMEFPAARDAHPRRTLAGPSAGATPGRRASLRVEHLAVRQPKGWPSFVGPPEEAKSPRVEEQVMSRTEEEEIPAAVLATSRPGPDVAELKVSLAVTARYLADAHGSEPDLASDARRDVPASSLLVSLARTRPARASRGGVEERVGVAQGNRRVLAARVVRRASRLSEGVTSRRTPRAPGVHAAHRSGWARRLGRGVGTCVSERRERCEGREGQDAIPAGEQVVVARDLRRGPRRRGSALRGSHRDFRSLSCASRGTSCVPCGERRVPHGGRCVPRGVGRGATPTAGRPPSREGLSACASW